MSVDLGIHNSFALLKKLPNVLMKTCIHGTSLIYIIYKTLFGIADWSFLFLMWMEKTTGRERRENEKRLSEEGERERKKRGRQTHGKRERDRDRERDTERERHRERERQRERERIRSEWNMSCEKESIL